MNKQHLSLSNSLDLENARKDLEFTPSPNKNKEKPFKDLS